jgi:hypothetical protein
MVFDLHDKASFTNLRSWHEHVSRFVDARPVLIGTKKDLGSNYAVNPSEVQVRRWFPRFSVFFFFCFVFKKKSRKTNRLMKSMQALRQEWQCAYFEVSSKTGEGVHEMMTFITSAAAFLAFVFPCSRFKITRTLPLTNMR